MMTRIIEGGDYIQQKCTIAQQEPRPKRSQVKNACSSCQKACKKCDVGRPCMRCIKFRIADTCVDSVRRERSKGER